MRSLSNFLSKEPPELADAELLRSINRKSDPWRARIAAGLAATVMATLSGFWLRDASESEASTYPLPRCSFDQSSSRTQAPEFREWRDSQITTPPELASNAQRTIGVVACDREIQDKVVVNGRECLAAEPRSIGPEAIPTIHVPAQFSAYASCVTS